jgi:hypothetical protein
MVSGSGSYQQPAASEGMTNHQITNREEMANGDVE